MKLVLNRNHTLNSIKGHSIEFRKGEATLVPPSLYAEALAIGAMPPDGEEVIKDERPANSAPSDAEVRNKDIAIAILALVKDNNANDFTAAGSPKVSAVSRVVGYESTAREVAAMWQAYHTKEAEQRVQNASDAAAAKKA